MNGHLDSVEGTRRKACFRENLAVRMEEKILRGVPGAPGLELVYSRAMLQ